MYTGTLAPFSNRQDWIIAGTLVDEDTGEDVTLTSADLPFYLTKQETPATVVLEASDGARITYPTSTSFQIALTPEDLVIRGWDIARRVDTNRVFGSAQAQGLQSHFHQLAAGNFGNFGQVYRQSDANNPGTHNTTSVGGTESRPRNVAKLPCIRYR